MAGTDDDVKQIAELVEQYRRGFGTMDVDALKGLWDPTHDGLVDVAAERPEPLTDWQAISDYYEQLPTGLLPDRPVVVQIAESTR